MDQVKYLDSLDVSKKFQLGMATDALDSYVAWSSVTIVSLPLIKKVFNYLRYFEMNEWGHMHAEAVSYSFIRFQCVMW